MPLDLMTLSLVSQPVSMEEGVKILERDHYRCQYCGLDGLASFDNALAMSVDFVVPRARKGKKDPQNLVACCRACNMIKGRKVSAYPACQVEVELAGAEYMGIPVDQAVTDGNLVTAPAWPAHPAWIAQFLAVLGTRISV